MLTNSSVVGAGVAKLVVFHRIIYGMPFISLYVFRVAISQYTDPYQRLDTAAGDVDVTCTCYYTPAEKSFADQNKDLLTPTVYWPMVESSLGVVGACLPLLRPIFTDTSAKSIFSSLRTMLSLSSFRSDSTNAPSQDYYRLEAGNIQTPQSQSVDGTTASLENGSKAMS